MSIIINNNSFSVNYDLSENLNTNIKFDIVNQRTRNKIKININVDANFTNDDLRCNRTDFNVDGLNTLLIFSLSKIVFKSKLYLHVKCNLEHIDENKNDEYFIAGNLQEYNQVTNAELLTSKSVTKYPKRSLNFGMNNYNGIINPVEFSLIVKDSKFLSDGLQDGTTNIINFNKKFLQLTTHLKLTLILNDGSKLIFGESANVRKIDKLNKSYILNGVNFLETVPTLNILKSSIDKLDMFTNAVHIDENKSIEILTNHENLNEKITIGYLTKKLIEKISKIKYKFILGSGLSGNGLINIGYHDGDVEETLDSDLIVGNGTGTKPSILFYIKQGIINGLSGINIKSDKDEILLTNNKRLSSTNLRTFVHNQQKIVITPEKLTHQLEHKLYIPTITFFIFNVKEGEMEKIDIPFSINIKTNILTIFSYPNIENNTLLMVING